MKNTFFLFLIALALKPASADAARSLTFPSLLKRIELYCDRTSLTTRRIAPPAINENAAFHYKVDVLLSNISNVAQTGSITLLADTTASSVKPGTAAAANVRYFICAATTTDGATLPLNGNISIPANSSVTATLGVVFWEATDVMGCWWDTTFSPRIKLDIAQDRGAVLASVVHNIDGAGTGSLCSGYSLPSFIPSSSLDLPDDRTGNPILLNGGRPF